MFRNGRTTVTLEYCQGLETRQASRPPEQTSDIRRRVTASTPELTWSTHHVVHHPSSLGRSKRMRTIESSPGRATLQADPQFNSWSVPHKSGPIIQTDLMEFSVDQLKCTTNGQQGAIFERPGDCTGQVGRTVQGSEVRCRPIYCMGVD